MSYILDALRKADAQRESDASRGIHAHPTPLGASGARAAPPAWWWGAGAAAVALIAWGGWWLVQDKGASQAAGQATASASPAVPPEAGPAAGAPAIVPPPPATLPAAPSVRAVQSRETYLSKGMGVPPMTPTSQLKQPRPPAPAATNAAAPAPPAAAVAAAPSVAGLPPDAPHVSISGGVYSPSPAQRMLIVNGQVFNEGSEIAPGLAIDEIKPRSAILKFRGGRYSVAY